MGSEVRTALCHNAPSLRVLGFDSLSRYQIPTEFDTRLRAYRKLSQRPVATM